MRQGVRIAIDARELTGRPTGVGRYLAEILAAWTALPDAADHEFVLCAPEDIDTALFTGLRISSVARAGTGTLWEQFTLPRLVRDADAAVLFSPGYTCPLLITVPAVVTIHDVSFAARPEWFTWREGARRRVVARMSAERACRVLTISEFSRREIVAHLGIDAGKIAVVYPGLTRIATSSQPLSQTASARQHSVLFVGSIFNRRHVSELVEGFGLLARQYPDVHLDVVGDNRTAPPVDLGSVAARAGAADRVHLRSYVSDEELGRLYGRAAAFAFLSEYEGFGLTPLEALGAGIPILVLDTPIAREIYGDAATYVPQPDPRLIADALARLLFDAALRTEQLAAAARLVSRYRWDSCAESVLRVLVACA
jgi:glycosyltransferase involved in cell wall biosynthesis